MKHNVTTQSFIEWYFKPSDAQWILKDLKFHLYNTGEFKIDLFELFEDCISIPANITLGYNHKTDLNKEYKPNECKLIR